MKFFNGFCIIDGTVCDDMIWVDFAELDTSQQYDGLLPLQALGSLPGVDNDGILMVDVGHSYCAYESGDTDCTHLVELDSE